MAPYPLLIFSLVLSLFHCLPTTSLCLSTISLSHTSNHTLVCALIPSPSIRESFLNCTSFGGSPNPVSFPGAPVSSIAGGNGFLCAFVTASTENASYIRCWRFSGNGTLLPFPKYETLQSSKRIYLGPPLHELAAGPTHLCGIVGLSRRLECWQWDKFEPPDVRNLSGLAVGGDFFCGLTPSGNAACFGPDSGAINAPLAGNYAALAAGVRHVCGITATDGSLQCWGPTAPTFPPPAGVFDSVALSGGRACAIRTNGTALCWGDGGDGERRDFRLPELLADEGFIAVTGNGGGFCGILSRNYSLVCWGDQVFGPTNITVVFERVQPGPCRSQCSCPLQNSGDFCPVGQAICRQCPREEGGPLPSPSPPASPNSPAPRSGRRSRGRVALLTVGSIGSALGLASLSYFVFVFIRFCKGRNCRVHDSGRLDEEAPPPPPPQSPASHPDTSYPTSMVKSEGGDPKGKQPARWMSSGSYSNRRLLNLPEVFPLEALRRVTADFSEEHKIGFGSFGSVYRAKLDDGREVAIKRADISCWPSYAGAGTGAGATKRKERESAFLAELALLSPLNHKNLVRLLGFCEEGSERVLVYEYMANGTLHDHLHRLDDSPLVAWTRRIKVALDAARGVEYLHAYAVPPIIHRDIKSSNILLDSGWTAKVSDFGLSLLGPSDGAAPLSLAAAGTVGYMDPEYYRLQRLTAKSDVYSFGVLLLELLSGMRAIHRIGQDGPRRNVVDYVVPYILSDELHRVLDRRVPPPTPYEIEAVNYVGHLAAYCVRPEGRHRPTMTEIVAGLEKALIECYAMPPLPSRSHSSGTDSSGNIGPAPPDV